MALTDVTIASERRLTRPLQLRVDGISALNAMTDDFLRLSSLQGQEGISQPFQFTLELRADDVEQLDRTQVEQLASFDTADVVGLWASVRLSRPWSSDRFAHSPDDDLPSWEESTPSRFFQGVVTSMTLQAPGSYQMVLGSPLHFLTLRNRYHIYHGMDVQALFSKLLQRETQSGRLTLEFRFDSSLTVSRVQDWLQAGETDMAFLQRVAGHAAVHFYFIHKASGLTLVFSNRPTALQEVDIPNCNSQPLTLRYSYSSAEKLGLQQDDLLCDMGYQVKLVTESVDAVLTREQAQWEENDVAGFTSYNGDPEEQQSPQYLRHHRYAYGTNRSEAEGQLKKLKQEIATDQETLTGSATSPLLSPGYTFQLSQPSAASSNVSRLMRQQFSGKTFVVTSIQHKASDDKPYSGQLQATEVNVETDSNNGTLLTPFSMDSTQQGSVLAKVIETAVPRGWRYREKNNYQVEQSQNTFDGSDEKEKGCLVQFATALDSSEQFWVRLSSSSTSAPEVGAMVMVSRAQNDSELPELNVVASHGSKTVQPPDRRNQSWTANTSWGSSYSCSYGDGISLRYGYSSAVNFEQEKAVVERAYDQPDMLGHSYDNASFSRGGGYSISVSNQDAAGVSGASVSAGSSYNESHALISYGYSDTGTSQSYSKVGKSVSRSVVGEYDGTVDLANPSFIDGKVPEQSIIDIADSLSEGDSYSEHHAKGRSISLSGQGTSPPSFGGSSAIVYSDSAVSGDTVNKSTHLGNASNTSTHIGNSDAISTTIGNSDNINTTIGNSAAISTQIGNTVGLNTFMGTRTDISTTLAAVNNLSTFLGMTNHIDTYLGMKNTISTQLAATNTINTSISSSNTVDTSIGASNSVSTHISTSNDVATKISASNSVATNIGASNSVTTNISASNNVSTTIGAFNNTETFIGAKNSTSTALSATVDSNIRMGSSISSSVSMAADISSSTFMGAKIDSSTFLGVNASFSTTAGITIRSETDTSVHIDMKTAPVSLKPTKPSVEIEIDSGPQINMLVMQINL
ncbi:contractile injection system protein, VgrG/Pvc8 family [Aliagarivorans marinus]|uniref:contractile injection system protein, VgrG/Pvc8 family n=1 Tax=Aliagarivorans marinus TaxID=561965 RepID=UPI0004151289|nr:contractile injection system protein, VgrG/Pvc8 family [Aliagarivorans marinus]